MAENQQLQDQDAGKGAVEGDRGNTSLAGQNPHRTESSLIKANDSDFPEPGGSPEHSGGEEPALALDQHRRAPAGDAGRSPEREQVNQDPGQRQKENQNKNEDDPLAA